MIRYLLASTEKICRFKKKNQTTYVHTSIIFKDRDLNKSEDTFHQYVSIILVEIQRMKTTFQLTSVERSDRR